MVLVFQQRFWMFLCSVNYIQQRGAVVASQNFNIKYEKQQNC